MDEQPIIQSTIQPPQIPQTSVSPNFFSKNKHVLIIISVLIISLVIIFTGVMIYQKYTKIPSQALSQLSNVKTTHPLIEGLKSYSKNNAISFAGKVEAKSSNSLVLVAETQTIRVELDNKSSIRLIDQAEFSKNPELFWAKSPKYIQLSEIEIGDNVNALGYGNEKLLKAFSIIIRK